LIPIFLGLVLGAVVGNIPIPGLHTTIKLGLAGGPPLVAIALAQLSSLGLVVWYMPPVANRFIRDFGLAIFLACVGLRAGAGFIQHAANTAGVMMFLCGAAITVLPVLLVGWAARLLLRMNFITLSGWVAGTMASTPTLLFANEQTASASPAIAYAAVTPLMTLVPIPLAQVLAII
jgi:putative transport protein